VDVRAQREPGVGVAEPLLDLLTFLPSANSSDAHVCLKVWKLTQGAGSSFPATSVVSPTAAAAGLSTRPARLGRSHAWTFEKANSVFWALVAQYAAEVDGTPGTPSPLAEP
jgi:hypothetical protein